MKKFYSMPEFETIALLSEDILEVSDENMTPIVPATAATPESKQQVVSEE